MSENVERKVIDNSQSGVVEALEKPASNQFQYDFAHCTLADVVRCGAALRTLGAQSGSMEEAAQKLVRYFYDNVGNRDTGRRSCVLVRMFLTQAYGRLGEELRAFADSMAPSGAVAESTRCLSLMATAGDDPRWNSRHSSVGHKCIPLVSEAMLERFPMIVQLVNQLGLSTSHLVRMTPKVVRELGQKSFGVFHVPLAQGSPYVPAQRDFVAPNGVASVLGFGGMLPDGNLFVVIIFARDPILAVTAEMFRTIALNLKVGLLALMEKPVFAD